MGLSGVKKKQVISSDPQNLHWKNDKSSFGFKMLQKMGWTEGRGLGVNEDGDTEHVKIKLKENNFGLGADIRTVDNWLGNTSAFSKLLQSLNSSSALPESEKSEKKSKRVKDKSEKKSKRVKDKSEKKSKKVKDKSEKKSKKVKDKSEKNTLKEEVVLKGRL